MSSRHARAGVLTLNRIVLPRFTLMSVAKPWIVVSPLSKVGISQVVDGVPGRQFSFSMSLAGAAHELYAFDDTTSSRSSAEHQRARQPTEKIRVVFFAGSAVGTTGVSPLLFVGRDSIERNFSGSWDATRPAMGRQGWCLRTKR